MPQWQTQSHPDTTINAGGSSFFSLWGDNASGSEENVQNKAYTAFTFGDLRINVTNHAGAASNISFRDDGSSSTNVTIAASSAAWLEDLTGVEAVAANSLVGILLDNPGMHGDDITLQDLLLTMEHASINAPMVGSSPESAIDVTKYFGLINSGGTTTEAEAKVRIKRATTFANLMCIPTSPTGTWTFDLRVNGSSSTNLTIGSITSGALHEDITGTEAVSVDDDVNFRVNEDVAGDFSDGVLQVDLDTAESWFGGSGNSATTREYLPFNSSVIGVTTADDNYDANIGSVTAGNLQTYVTVAGSGTRDVKLRVGSTDSTNLNIPITTTGLAEDVTGSEAVVNGNNITISMASTGSSFTIQRVAVELPWASGAVEIAVAGVQPAATGTIAQKYIIKVEGTQPASTGILVGLFTNKELKGNQPAPTGTIAAQQTLLRSVAGNQPSATGDAVGIYLITVDGNQPSSTGTIISLFANKELKGNQPSPAGTISVQYQIAIAGSQPSATGGVTVQYQIAVSGNQPSAAGDVTFKFNILVEGVQPAPTGIVTQKYLILVEGNQPAPTGAIVGLHNVVNLAGNQPSATGSFNLIKYLIAVSGSQPAASGDVTTIFNVNVVGSQPASSGIIVSQQTLNRSVVGSQPSSTGSIAIVYQISISGSQPAPSGVFGLIQSFVIVSGNQPAPSGVIVQKYLIVLVGVQPAPAGTITSLPITGAVTISGNQPAPSGVVTAFLMILVTGNQPSPSGALAFAFIAVTVILTIQAQSTTLNVAAQATQTSLQVQPTTLSVKEANT